MDSGRVWLAALGAWALLAGCEGSRDSQLRSAFDADFHCKSAEVHFKGAQYEVAGCGKRGSYTCDIDGEDVGCFLTSRGEGDGDTGKPLVFSTTLEPTAELKVAAWIDGEKKRFELSLWTLDNSNCPVDLLIDARRIDLDPPGKTGIGVDPELLTKIGWANWVALRGCGGEWQLTSDQLDELKGFVWKLAEKLAWKQEPTKQDGPKRAPPVGGWPAWKGLDAFPNFDASASALSGPELFAKLSPSVLRVESENVLGRLQGSAVAVSPTRAITNCHVVEGAKKIEVKQAKQSWTASLAQSDPDKDRCVLEVAGAAFTPVKGVRPYADLQVGEPLYTLGNPSGLDLTLTDGILSARREEDGVRYVQTSAPISPGSSGGGLFDARGNLVGITTLSYVGRERLNQSLNFAIAAELFWSP